MRTITKLIILSIIIREIFSFWTGHPYDFEMFVRVGEQLYYGKPLYVFISAYQDVSFWPYGTVGYAYPPLFAYYCMLSYAFYKEIGIDLPFLYYFLLKQPMILGDVLCGYLIYKLKLKYYNISNLKATMIWLFNPITILFSAIWGIPHALAISFILLYLLYFENKFSFIYLVISFLLIGLPFIYILSFIFLFLKDKKVIINTIILFFIMAIILPLLSLIPFQLENQLNNIYMAVEDVFFKKALGQFNIFMIFNFLYYLNHYSFNPLIFTAFQIIPYIWLPTLIFVIIFYRLNYVKKIDFKNIYLIFFLVTITFLIFRQSVNEQYILYFLSLALINYEYLNPKLKTILLFIQINTFLFILVNNPLLIRFATPIDQHLYLLDIQFTTTEPTEFIRYMLMTIFGSLNTIFLILFLKKLGIKNL